MNTAVDCTSKSGCGDLNRAYLSPPPKKLRQLRVWTEKVAGKQMKICAANYRSKYEQMTFSHLTFQDSRDSEKATKRATVKKAA